MSALLVALVVGLAAAPADEDRIRIVSDLDAAVASQLSPGATVEWFVDVSTTPGDPGTIDIALTETGNLALEVAAFRCDTEWGGSVCATGETRLREQGALPEGQTKLLSIPDTDSAHLRLVVVAPKDLPTSTAGALHLVASGAGDSKDADGPHTPLRPTGSMPVWGLICAAIGALGAGVVITAKRVFGLGKVAATAAEASDETGIRRDCGGR